MRGKALKIINYMSIEMIKRKIYKSKVIKSKCFIEYFML